mgnify:CR=1 FL=1
MTTSEVKVNQAIATEKVEECPLCQRRGLNYYRDLTDRLNNSEGEWSFIKCDTCGILWLNPRPLSSELSKIYQNYFTHEEISPYIKEGGEKNRIEKILKEFLLPRRRYELTNSKTMFLGKKKPGKLLDIGCGNGSFLAGMRDLGWDVVGLEPDKKAAQIAEKQFQLKVYSDTLENLNLGSELFDAITLSHVLEHVINPRDVLSRCHSLLKSEGLLSITTPNINSFGHQRFKEFWYGLEPPRHFVLFNRNGLEKLLIDTGFEIKESVTFSRMASGIYRLSNDIRRSFPGISRYKNMWSDNLKRMIFVAVEYWINYLDEEKGEEIGILAQKI